MLVAAEKLLPYDPHGSVGEPSTWTVAPRSASDGGPSVFSAPQPLILAGVPTAGHTAGS